MTHYKVKQAKEILGVSHVTIHKKLKRYKKELQGKVLKKKGVTFLTQEAIDFLETVVTGSVENKHEKEETGNRVTSTNHSEAKESQEQLKGYKELLETLQETFQGQVSDLRAEIERQSKTITRLLDNQEKMTQSNSEERERTDTIIMKLTQDLEQVRNENRLLLEESKKREKEPEKKPKKKKTDRVISIQEFINAKIEEDIQRSKFEEEQRRLKKQYSHPLNGKSTLYKLYIKMFRPDMLREAR
jgi:hypothetical protein